jgi:hypothetical protein
MIDLAHEQFDMFFALLALGDVDRHARCVGVPSALRHTIFEVLRKRVTGTVPAAADRG